MLGVAWLDVSTGLFETAAPGRRRSGRAAGQVGAGGDPGAGQGFDLGEWAAKPRRRIVVAPAPIAGGARVVAEAFGAASLEAFGVFSDAEMPSPPPWRSTTCG